MALGSYDLVLKCMGYHGSRRRLGLLSERIRLRTLTSSVAYTCCICAAIDSAGIASKLSAQLSQLFESRVESQYVATLSVATA